MRQLPDSSQAAPFITSIIDAGRVSEGLSSCAPGADLSGPGFLRPALTEAEAVERYLASVKNKAPKPWGQK